MAGGIFLRSFSLLIKKKSPETSASFAEIREKVPAEEVGLDGTWLCGHGVVGLSCEQLRCRYDARIIEAFNRHLRLATEARRQAGMRLPKGCYFSPRELTDEEALTLSDDWQRIQAAFSKAGLEMHKT